MTGFSLRLPGQYFDEETGNHYNYFRDYDPTIGRYLTADPMGLTAGTNFYGYANQSPLNFLDPLGLDAIVIAFPDYSPTIPSDVPLIGGTRPAELGHAGILIFDDNTGLTRYYEFGRYNQLESGGVAGAVRNYSVPNLVIGGNGLPTQASLNAVFSEISTRSAGGTRIEAANVDGVDFSAMDNFGNSAVVANADPTRDPYSFIGNNCGHFTYDMLTAGGLNELPSILNPMPSNFVDELVEEGYDFITWTPDE